MVRPLNAVKFALGFQLTFTDYTVASFAALLPPRAEAEDLAFPFLLGESRFVVRELMSLAIYNS